MSIAVNTKAVCLFSSTSPHLYGPFTPGQQRIIYKKYACSPCNKSVCPRTKNKKTYCMENISADEVWAEIEKMLW